MNVKKGIVFNIQRYCIHDGPGIRTTVFLKGCPLRCAWCSNPESHKTKPETGYDKNKCIGCHRCVSVCPQHALKVAEDGSIRRNNVQCDTTLCRGLDGALPCCKNCPPKAMIQYGREMTSTQVVDEAEKDTIFYRDGGGLTLSGGEPLFQGEFALAILREARERHIHTAIETTCYVDRSVLNDVCSQLNFINLDIKSLDDEIHKKYTGVRLSRILDNLKFIHDNFPNIQIRIRTPVIPGVNDCQERIEAIADFIRPMTDMTYELLPYHSMGRQKYGYLGREYGIKAERLSQDRFKSLCEAAKNILSDRFVMTNN